jgi:Family of unknown function (DUF6920)
MVFTLLGLLALTAGLISASRLRFLRRLRNLEQRLKTVAGATKARDDLPPEIAALAERQGAKRSALAAIVTLKQAGTMRSAPEAKEMRFSACQIISAVEPGFLWRAKFAPAGLVLAADYFVGGKGGLEARIGGVFPVVRPADGDAAAKGELMRYLAELPWHPDAIFANRALDWQVLDQSTIKVAAGQGATRAEVTLHLNPSGFVASVEASGRPQIVDGVTIERPWRGRCWDYRQSGGHMIPTQAEVAWVIDGKEFVYWKGRVENWQAERSTGR